MIGKTKEFVSVCSNCKKTRLKNTNPLKQDSWIKVEKYFMKKDTLFTHGLCPECAKKLYAEFLKEKE